MHYLFDAFTKYLNLTLLLIAMCAMVNTIGLYICISNWIPPMSLIVQICRAILISYCAVLIYGLLRSWKAIIGNIFVLIIILALFINSLIDTIVYLKYHIFFPYDFVIAICDTNIKETGAYFQTILDIDTLLLVIVEIIILIGIYVLTTKCYRKFAPRLRRFREYYFIGCLCILLLSVCGTAYGSKLIGGNSDIIGKVKLFSKYKPSQEIKAKTPELCFSSSNSDKGPDEIVIIVGESLSKDHCQLYGYGKPTQPRLTKLAKDSVILIFQNAKTSASYTVATFQNIIGVWSDNLPTDSAWYKCPTFLQIEKVAGYHTAWISSQDRHGDLDSPIAIMSHIADSAYWTTSWWRDKEYYDEDIIQLLKSRNTVNSIKKLSLLHITGSHIEYSDRYPDNRAHFKPSEYTSVSDSKSQNLATYDNSVLYNDSVIYEIIHLYEKKDALVLYFSDHGEDLYQSDEEFYGHGCPKGSKSWEITSNIPFVVYMSPVMKNKHSALAERINASVNKEINTTNLTYTLMDITGVYIKGHKEDNKNSFFY